MMWFKKIRFRLWHFYVLLVALWLARFYAGYFMPKDDLLRHAVAYRWGYDYGIPYIESVFRPAYDYYLGFDAAMGVLHRYLGESALAIPQILALSLSFWGVTKLLGDMELSTKAAVIALFIKLTWGRLILGRPSLICSSIMIFLMAYNHELKGWMKAACGLVLSLLYHFFGLYLIPLVFYDKRYLFPLAGGLAFWLAYSQGGYFGEIYRIVASLGEQNMAVAENKTILTFFAASWVFTLPMFYNFKKDLKTFAAVTFFSLSNQARYTETIVPLILSFFRFVRIKIPAVVSLGIASYLLLSIAPPQSPFMGEIPANLPQGARVLSDNMGVMYQLIFTRPDLKVSPNYAYGWTDPEVQLLLKKLHQGRADCGSNTIHKFDYLLESSLKGAPLKCLELAATDKERRLWKIISRP